MAINTSPFGISEFENDDSCSTADNKSRKHRKRIGVFASVNGYAARIYGQDLKTHFTDVSLSFRAQCLAKQLHGYDDTPTYGWADWGGWEFGGDIQWPSTYHDASPSTLRNPVEIPSDLDRLEVPDPKNAGSYALLRKFNRILVENNLKPRIRAGSVTSVVAGMIGMERLLRWFIKEPEAVRTAYEKATQLILLAAESAVEEFGRHISASISAPLDSNGLISPSIFEEFALPYHDRIIRGLTKLGIDTIKLHLCGDHLSNLPFWEQLPWPEKTSISIGSELGIVSTAKAFNYRFKIGGNVSTTLLMIGRYEDIYEASWQCMEAGKDLPAGFDLMPACEMPVLTPPLNVQAMVDACHDFNKNILFTI